MIMISYIYFLKWVYLFSKLNFYDKFSFNFWKNTICQESNNCKVKSDDFSLKKETICNDYCKELGCIINNSFNNNETTVELLKNESFIDKQQQQQQHYDYNKSNELVIYYKKFIKNLLDYLNKKDDLNIWISRYEKDILKEFLTNNINKTRGLIEETTNILNSFLRFIQFNSNDDNDDDKTTQQNDFKAYSLIITVLLLLTTFFLFCFFLILNI